MPVDFVFVPATVTRSSKAAVSSIFFFFDPAQVRRLLASAADSGFDAVLVDDAGGPLTNVDIAASIARWNAQLDVILTHWADVTSPAIAASDFAALDRLTGGRLSLRIQGGEPEVEGFLETWKRTDEYLTLLKRLWSSDRPINHEGPFYSLRHSLVADKGLRGHEIPIRMSGRTGTEIDVAARHATVFELPDMRPEQLSSEIDRVRIAAARYGRSDKIAFAARVHIPGDGLSDLTGRLLSSLSAGVTGFMVSGLNDTDAIERFGNEVIAPLRNHTVDSEREMPGLVATSLAMGLF